VQDEWFHNLVYLANTSIYDSAIIFLMKQILQLYIIRLFVFSNKSMCFSWLVSVNNIDYSVHVYWIFSTGKQLPDSPSNTSCDDKLESNEEEETDHDGHTDPDYSYSKSADQLTGDERQEIIGLASTGPGNPAFVTVLQRTHLQRKNNFLVSFISYFRWPLSTCKVCT
jgi:hypothetical protein